MTYCVTRTPLTVRLAMCYAAWISSCIPHDTHIQAHP